MDIDEDALKRIHQWVRQTRTSSARVAPADHLRMDADQYRQPENKEDVPNFVEFRGGPTVCSVVDEVSARGAV